jgi:hypothetical protein
MPDYLATEQLREMVRGDFITAELMNAIIRAVKAVMFGEDGFADGGGSAFRTKDRSRQAFPIVAEVFEAVPIHSILGVFEGAGSGIPCKTYAGKVGFLGSGGSPLGLFTNDKIAIAAGAKLLLRPINDYDPILVAVTGELPGVGEPCGPELDTFGVTALSSGFVCLSEPINGVAGSGAEYDYVWVMKTATPPIIMGEVQIPPPGNDSSGSGDVGNGSYEIGLSSGTMKVLYRGSGESDDELRYATSPITGETPWVIVFWAKGGSGEIPGSGEIITVGSTLGIGMMLLEGTGGGQVMLATRMTSGTWAKGEEEDLMRVHGNFTSTELGVLSAVVNRFAPIEWNSTSGAYIAVVSIDGKLHAIAAECLES